MPRSTFTRGPAPIALCVLSVALVGCRAVLGIEDPPSEAGPASSSVSSSGGSAGGTTTSSSGGGGAPSSSASTTTTSGIVSAGSAGDGGAGGGAGGSSGAGGHGGSGPLDEYVLAGVGVRLAWDEGGDEGDTSDDRLYAVDAAANYWAFRPDLRPVQRCTVPMLSPDELDGGYLAGSANRIAYSVPKRAAIFFTVEGDVDLESPCVSPALFEEFEIAGMVSYGLNFYGLGLGDAWLYRVEHPSGELEPIFPTGSFVAGGSLAIKGQVAYGIAINGALDSEVLTFDLEGDGGQLDYFAQDPASFVAVAGTPSGVGYAWLRAPGVDRVVGSGIQFPNVPYAGTPSFDADDAYLYVPSEDGLVICESDEGCVTLGAGEGRVNDVKSTTQGLFMLQGNRIRRFEPMTSGVFGTLPDYGRTD